jgi:hypothetical protein
MSYKTFFTFAAGLNKTLKVPIGTKESIQNHIDWIESTLNIEREKYLENPAHWKYNDFLNIKDDILCDAAEKHNDWVRWIYDGLADWSNKEPDICEEITNEDFQGFLPALSFIKVKSERWNGEYYTKRMEALYEVMRGRENEGISFDAKKLTEKQAAQVIILFSEFLDHEDRRLDVPKDCDYLASSYDGGYEWCEKCGAITYEHSLNCRKRGCPLQKQYKEENAD